jgi:flagellar protein FliO/FliZ
MSFDIGTYAQFLLALVFVLALIGVLALVARRLGLGGALPATRGQRRLAVVESLAIDGRRRLVLVRRDGTEHLLVLGAGSETVIETAIAAPVSGFAAAVRSATSPGTGAERSS